MTPRPRERGSAATWTASGSYDDIRYIRLNNTPNHKVLHGKLAALENTEAGLVAKVHGGAPASLARHAPGAGIHLL